MRDLNYELKRLCDRNRDGAFATQNKRLRTLDRVADTLHDLGYRKLRASSIKPKHVEALVNHWKEQALSAGSIKNNMTALRWWAEKVGKRAVVARDNDYYGIDRRQFVTGTDRSQELDRTKLAAIRNEHVRMSVELQAAFGLRREEAIKFQPSYAMATLSEGHIQLKESWTKGGKARVVPLSPELSEQQLDVLRRAAVLAGKGSLIPSDKRYVDQLRAYERNTKRAGLSRLHGLRHRYAQARYEALMGFPAPARGGPLPKSMSAEVRAQDHEARLTISRELGHERKQIVAIYLGG